MTGCLSRARVLDLSRIFAGPWAAQMLADFGADVIKVERPRRGDDVRQQGYRVKDREGRETSETSSFLAMNRGKRSVTIDLASTVGQDLIRRLARESDILIENFKAGDLRRYGLDYETLSRANPRLVYCSITGFGQSGPYSHLPGYDPIFQSMSGLMSVTGNPDDEPGGGPQKVGYSIADITAGLYASIAILAALNYRDTVSGKGQYIDLALLDAQVAAMSHVAMNYLVSGRLQERMGTASPITCPWQTFKCAEGDITIAVGNDPQFVRFCEVLGKPALASDPRFSTNPMRAKNRKTLVPMLEEAFLDALRTGVVRGVRSGRRPERADLRLPAGVRGSADPAPRAADRDDPPAGGSRADGRQSDQVLRHAHRVPPAAAAAGRAHPGGPARGAPSGRGRDRRASSRRSDLT